MRRGTLFLALGALLAGGARAGMPPGVVTKIVTSPTLGRSTPGGKAPPFTLKAADGGTFTLEKAGRPVLLTFIYAKGNVVARHDGPEVDQKLLDEDVVEAARRSKDG